MCGRDSGVTIAIAVAVAVAAAAVLAAPATRLGAVIYAANGGRPAPPDYRAAFAAARPLFWSLRPPNFVLGVQLQLFVVAAINLNERQEKVVKKLINPFDGKLTTGNG